VPKRPGRGVDETSKIRIPDLLFSCVLCHLVSPRSASRLTVVLPLPHLNSSPSFPGAFLRRFPCAVRSLAHRSDRSSRPARALSWSKTQHSAREFQGEIAKAQRHAGHSREASTAFTEACTAYLRIMSRIEQADTATLNSFIGEAISEKSQPDRN
jgi:hypothetical protein